MEGVSCVPYVDFFGWNISDIEMLCNSALGRTERAQEHAGPWGSFVRLWESWLTLFGYQSCPYGRGRKWEDCNQSHSQALAFLQKEPTGVNHSCPEGKVTYKC